MNALRKRLPELLWCSAFCTIVLAAVYGNNVVCGIGVIGSIVLGCLALVSMKNRSDEGE
jgi:hypothetical protein